MVDFFPAAFAFCQPPAVFLYRRFLLQFRFFPYPLDKGFFIFQGIFAYIPYRVQDQLFHYDHADIMTGAGLGIVAVIGTHIFMVGLVGTACVTPLMVHLRSAVGAIENTRQGICLSVQFEYPPLRSP